MCFSVYNQRITQNPRFSCIQDLWTETTQDKNLRHEDQMRGTSGTGALSPSPGCTEGNNHLIQCQVKHKPTTQLTLLRYVGKKNKCPHWQRLAPGCSGALSESPKWETQMSIYRAMGKLWEPYNGTLVSCKELVIVTTIWKTIKTIPLTRSDRAMEKARWANALAAKPNDLTSILEPTRQRMRTNSRKLSSDLHTHPWYVQPPPLTTPS